MGTYVMVRDFIYIYISGVGYAPEPKFIHSSQCYTAHDGLVQPPFSSPTLKLFAKHVFMFTEGNPCRGNMFKKNTILMFKGRQYIILKAQVPNQHF